jgi:hypothetical protein
LSLPFFLRSFVPFSCCSSLFIRCSFPNLLSYTSLLFFCFCLVTLFLRCLSLLFFGSVALTSD